MTKRKKIAQPFDTAQRIKDSTVREEITGCLLWARRVHPEGYAVMKVKGRQYQVARVVWAINDPQHLLPETGKVIRQTCKNRLCCEITHLEETTRAEVLRSVITKVTDSEIKQIVAMAKAGLTAKQIAKRFPITESRVRNIIHKHSRTHGRFI